jgi:hypothetical protein
MKFKVWLENEIESNAADSSPASAEVIRTGLQPQVGSSEIKTHQKDEQDKLMALDGHFQRIASILPSLSKQNPKLREVSGFCKKVLNKWDEIVKSHMGDNSELQSGFPNPSPNQTQWMKDNQPLPEMPGSAEMGQRF